MIKRLKRRRKKNQGNSFIMVVATLSFLAVLVAAILVAVALCYRLKAYDINSSDNFYYLEQAMDEIYAGVGGDIMEHLNTAYDETLEAMVYYDTSKKAYVTMTGEQANELMRSTYMRLVQNDNRYKSETAIYANLHSFLSRPYDDSDGNPIKYEDKGTAEGEYDGVKLSIGSYETTSDSLTICNLVLRREAKYSTINTKRTGTLGGSDTFVQTITTDLIIAKPEFDVTFNSSSKATNELYNYSMISDMGVEIVGSGTVNDGGATSGKTALNNKVSISGNVYAASDFYNKSYNEDPGTVNSAPGATTTVDADQIQKINSYSDKQLENFDGVNIRSMYSGFYVDGATVTLASDRIIIPGTLAVMNSADVSITGLGNKEDSSGNVVSSTDLSDVWADSIVLDGYSLNAKADGSKKIGSTLTMKAKAYISDDLEVNSDSASVVLSGKYYGYNYASTDNRVYSKDCTQSGVRKFTKNTDSGITDGVGIDGQAHYNSSAIILNGDNASLDFSLVSSLYVAGQSYIEVSKQNSENDTDTEKETTDLTYTVVETTLDSTGTQVVNQTVKELTDSVADKSYSYASSDDVDENGGTTDEDNYTVDNDSSTPSKTAIQDYRTGEAISIKSNQLAYIPNWAVHDDDDGIWVSLPARLRNLEVYQGIWDDFDKIPVIKTVVSGNKYYFFDFSRAEKTDAMNEFIANYASLFDASTATADGNDGMTTGEAYGLTNITDYEYFQVKMLTLEDATTDADGNYQYYKNIYTNSAITTRSDTSFSIVAKSDSIEPLLSAAKTINEQLDELGREDSRVLDSGTNSLAVSMSLTSKLQEQYKEVKWLLTDSSSNSKEDTEYVEEAHTLAEDDITPINHYFDFSKMTKTGYCDVSPGSYGVWVSDGDVKVGASSYSMGKSGETLKEYSYSDGSKYTTGEVSGIIIAKGDVTFGDDVTRFNGLIVSGGKIIVSNFGTKNSMTFSSDANLIKRILSTCDMSRGEKNDSNFGFVCDMFRQFKSEYVPETESDDVEIEREITGVQFEDVLTFSNWKKNVD